MCPVQVSCCTEYGYCRTREDWLAGLFRDCSGLSNGGTLPQAVLEMENALGGRVGAGLGAETALDKVHESGEIDWDSVL